MSTTSLRSAARLLLALAMLPGSASAADAATQHSDVRLEGREVVEPASHRLVVPHRASVALRWRSDEDVVLHLHGYDITVTLRAGIPSVTRFEARATGRFPVRSHGFGAEAGHAHGHRPLLWIEVHPD